MQKTNINIKLYDKSYVYGLGDKAKFLNHMGYEFISYNTDDPTPQNEQYKSLYKSINYLLINHNTTKYYGIFYPSTFKTYFNIAKDKFDLLNISSLKGENDFFLILGNDPNSITRSYSSLVGRPIMPTLKMLGNQQSRWSYYDENEVREIARKYRELKIPLDFIHLDIDYMDNFKDFTFNKERFPNISKLSEDLEKMGLGLVTILDAGIKEEQEYEVYDYLINNDLVCTLDNAPYVNEVWPGRSVFPNFMNEKTQEYFKGLTKKWLLEQKVKGIWCDMNEPASFKGPLPDNVEAKANDKIIYHDEFHNVYGESMVKGVSSAFKELNKRPYVITRAAFATTTKYSICWNGDNQSLWSHLQLSLPQICSMGISGFPFDGVDVGGFNFDATDELLTRFIEANVFAPFLRNHSACGSIHQEPWCFSQACLNTYRKMVNLRYQFIPYMYDLAYKAHIDGTPILRPLFYNFPFDENVKEINDEVMLGDNVLLAPILTQGSRSRSLYLPEGKWINYFTHEEYEGGKEYLLHLELGEIGLFIKKGSIIPTYKDLMYLEKNQIDTLIFDARYGDGEYINYEDDGESFSYLEGHYNLYKVKVDGDNISLEVLKNDYKSPYKKIVVITNTTTHEIKI
ncbi:MAG: TIM-barrel domain-containing protein [Bacilli bacterium]